MKYTSIRAHLKPYLILARRKTTINHAFAAAIAPSDIYDEQRIRQAIATLGQDPDSELLCAYCGASAQTWDHIFATVKNSYFSGYGHRLGNLLPCCKPCNSAKGNKDWRVFLTSLSLSNTEKQLAEERISDYITKFSAVTNAPLDSNEYQRLLQIRAEIFTLMAEADQLAMQIRAQYN